MSKYSLLENAIFSIDPGKFQKVCEYYIHTEYPGEFAAPGSVENKDKSRPGRPDIYVVQENGKYIIAEVTTHDDLDKNGYARKLKKDLNDSLDIQSMGIDPNKVELIVLFTNGTVELPLRDLLSTMAEEAGKKMRIVGFSNLVHYFYNNGRLFARDYLSIPFITGQILNKQQFLEFYQGKIATPLSNQLFGREKELEKLLVLIEKHQIISIAGKPGVGKSRLALEAIDLFLAMHKEYTPLYVLTTPESITEDIISYITPGNRYLVFIDDANRQLTGLLPVLAKALDNGIHLKLIVTVRDYAKIELETHFANRDFERVWIGVLEDEVIQNILYFEPFGLKNAAARNRIVKICRGNARLAIMAWDVYNKNNDINVLKDVSTIYDVYFQSIFNDNQVFSDPVYIKVLGLLSFFWSIDVDEPDDLAILKDFDIDISDFTRCIQVLESMEIVETKYLTIAKMSDQVLGTYFFYLTFFKRKLLNVNRLVGNYFMSHTNRVRDTFLPAISAFGEENVFHDNPNIVEFCLERFKGDRNALVSFFEIFGSYMPLKLLVFLDAEIQNTESDTTDFNFSNPYVNSNPISGDILLSLLTSFYKDHNKYFLTALGLSIKYVYKHKGLLDLLLCQLKSHFYQNDEDVKNGFAKLNACYDYLVDKTDRGVPEKTLFYYLLQHTLLNKDFDDALYLKDNERLCLMPEFQSYRVIFFEHMIQHYSQDRDIIYDILIGYLETNGRNAYAYLEADQPQLIQLINKNLSPNNFQDTYFVQQYLNLLLDKGITPHPLLLKIKRKFVNTEYRIIDTLGMNRRQRRRSRNQTEDYSSFWEAQVAYVKKEIKISSLEDFEAFYQAVVNYYKFPYWNRMDIAAGFAIVLEKIFQDDVDLGFLIMAWYLNKGNLVGFGPVRLFNSIFNLNQNLHCQLYKYISTPDYKDRQKWMQNYFEWLPPENVDHVAFDSLFKFISEVENGFELHLQFYQQYELMRPGTIKNLVEILHNRREATEGFVLKLPYHFFSKYPYLAETDFNFAMLLYLKQEKVDPSSDPNATDLLFLTERNADVFVKYIELKIENYKQYFVAPRKYLGNIWTLDAAEELVYQALMRVGSLQMSMISSEDFWGVFFINLKKGFTEKAISVIQRIIKEFSQDSRMLNMVWHVLRNYFKNDYQDAIKMWMMFNSDYNFFKKMDWTNSHFDYANGLPSQQRIASIETVKGVISSMPEPVLYVLHLAYLQNEIDMEQRNTNWEIKRMYRGLW